jgi:hypothetical protein
MGSAARFSDAAALSPKPATHAGAWTAPLSTADMERAVVALVKHRGALALLALEDGDGRMRLALAFLALWRAGRMRSGWMRWGGCGSADRRDGVSRGVVRVASREAAVPVSFLGAAVALPCTRWR